MKKLLILTFLFFSIQSIYAQCSTFTLQVTPLSNVTCNGQSDGAAAANPTGGLTPYNYAWSNGETVQVATGLPAGTHIVTVTDANSCVETSAIIVTEPPLLTQAINSTNSTCGACNGSLSIVVMGGTPPYTYQWSNGHNTQAGYNLCPGTYSVTVTDANGCVTLANAVIIPSGSSPIQLVVSVLNHVSCFSVNDGSATVVATGGIPPYTYLWSSGETTQTAIMLESGNQTVVVTDTSGCSKMDTIQINDTGVLFTVASTLVNCNANDGTATVTLNPTIPNPAFNWSNGETTPTITGLAEGWYSVTVENTDTGCRAKRLIEVEEDPSCVVTIEGYVYNDFTMPDCVSDPGTLPYEFIMISLSNGIDSTYVYTDSTGYYSFTADAGTYTVRLVPKSFQVLACAGSYSNIVNAPVLQTTYQGGDFYLDVVPVQNMATIISAGPARPGFTRTMFVHYVNKGSVPVTGTMRLVHDSLLTNFNGFGQEDSYDAPTRTATWSYTNILPGTSGKFPVQFDVPVSAQLGTTIRDTSYIEPVIGDLHPSDNTHNFYAVVTGAYDPNDKQNFTGTDPFGGDFYAEDSTFIYQVRFQNTGTDTAFTVVIRDTLDANLKVESFQFVDASHPYSIRFANHNIVEFWFENIMLPDSNVNEPESHGHVLFTIDRALNIPLGTTIENSAAIYFDFNPPVITNTVVNTLAVLASLGEEVSEEQLVPLALFPNPTSDIVQLKLDLPEAAEVHVGVYDVAGKLLRDELIGDFQKGEQQLQLSTKGLAEGAYFVRLRAGNLIGVAQLVVTR